MGKTIVAYGEILWDILPGATLLGGAPFNFIHRIHTLGGHGIIMSRLGKDDPGYRANDIIRSHGLDDSCIQWDEERPTGTVEVDVDDSGNPDFLIIPDVAYDYIEQRADYLDITASADCICFGTLVQRSALSRATLYGILEHAGNALKFLDINLRKKCFTPRDGASLARLIRHSQAQRRRGGLPDADVRYVGENHS